MRYCLHCGAIINPDADPRQMYCRPEHAIEARVKTRLNEKVRIAKMKEDGTFLKKNMELFQQAELLLLKQALPNAVGYLAGMSLDDAGEKFHYFPEKRKLRTRLDGSRTPLPYFELRPNVEPAMVPFSRAYRILYVDASGFIDRTQPWSLVNLPGIPMCWNGRKNIRNYR